MKFLFEVTMRPGHSVDEYAQGWVAASEIIQQTPGARGTYLHRKIGQPNVALAIAHWDSKAARDAKDDRKSAVVSAILDKHEQICDIKIIGEFEEPEWSVLPAVENVKGC